MLYLKGLRLQVEVVQMIFYLHHVVKVELDVHSFRSLRHLVQNSQER